jgi:hypothetical protein
MWKSVHSDDILKKMILEKHTMVKHVGFLKKT